MHTKSISVSLVETYYDTVFSSMIWNLSLSTGSLPHLLYGMNRLHYLSSSFKFSCIPIDHQVNPTLVSYVLFQSLAQQFGCPNGGGGGATYSFFFSELEHHAVCRDASQYSHKPKWETSNWMLRKKWNIHWKSYSLRISQQKNDY